MSETAEEIKEETFTFSDPMMNDYYGAIPVIKEEPEAKEEIKEEVKEEIAAEIKEEVKEEIKEAIQETKEAKEEVKPYAPEFKKDSDRWLHEKIVAGEEKEVYDALKKKFGHTDMNEEQKALYYLASKHPKLNPDQLSYLAASEYGIGATTVDEDLMTPEIEKEIRMQEIKKAGLIGDAENYFNSTAETYELPKLPNPIDADEDYKVFQEQKKNYAEQVALQEENRKQIDEEITNTAKTINDLDIKFEIEIDDSKLAIDSIFTLNAEKQKQLTEYAKDYTPTQEEIDLHTSKDKFDMGGYLSMLAKRKFQDQIIKAAVKEALVKDRENFMAKELKNTTLRNNDVSQVIEQRGYDIYTDGMGMPGKNK